MADSILRLKVESQEYDNKLKQATNGLTRYIDECRKVGGTLEFVEKETLDYVRTLGQMDTTSRTATGKLAEMKKTFTELSAQYKQMTDAERQSPFGKALAASLDQLKTRTQDAKKDLADVQQELSGSKFGQFGSILDGIGQKMGLNANITELLTSKTALLSAGIGAAGAIVGKATQEWAKYNAELAKQDQITTFTTGLKGPDSDRMTDQARALTDTYGVDFREAINAANTLMTQFGQTGEQAMSLIRDGMQGMIQGDGPKLLSMIQQYAPAFRDAGVSASQLVAVIQNSEGGIFTDQNMNAIVMGIKNIRLMTKATSDALAQLGIDGQKMSQQLSDGSLTIFDALKQVATQIQGVNSNSQAAGEVMQQVFGRQGAMAGTKLGEAIATLNTNLEETKRQTGEVGDAYNDLYNANVKLNGAIRDCFEYDGWDQMATGIKSSLVSALASVIEKLATIKQFLTGMSANDYLKQMGGSDKVNLMIGRLGNGQGNARNTYDRQVGAFEAYINPRKKYLENLDAWRRGNRSDDVKAEVEWGRNKFGIDDRAIRNSVKAAESQLEEYQKKAEQVFSNVNKKSGKINIDLTGGNKGRNKGGGNKGGKTEIEAAIGSIDYQTKKVQELQKAWRAAADDNSREKIKKEIEEQQYVLDRMTGKEKFDPSKMKKIKGTSLLPEINDSAIDAQTKKVQQLQEAWRAAADDDSRKKIKEELESAQKVLDNMNISAKKPVLRDPLEGLNTMKQSIQLELKTEAVKVDETTLQTMLKDAVQNGINGMDFQFNALGEKIGAGLDVPDSAWEGILEQYNALREQIGLEPITIDFKTGGLEEAGKDAKSATKDFQQAASAIGSVGNALSSIEDPSAKVAGIVAQAIATVASAFAGALGSDTTTKSNIWAFIAAAAASTATMVSTIASIHSATGYANGGQIKGNSYSGDNILGMVDGGGIVGLNAGEIVLNQAQTANVANALEGGGMSGIDLSARVNGEQIVLVANRYFKRTGQGEIVTWK